jgi:hypothetical protein
MLDRDLAELYGATTSNLNKAVTRNIERFPPDLMFRLSAEESRNLKFHSGASSWGQKPKPAPEPERRKIGFQVREAFVAPYRASGPRVPRKKRMKVKGERIKSGISLFSLILSPFSLRWRLLACTGVSILWTKSESPREGRNEEAENPGNIPFRPPGPDSKSIDNM